MKRLAIPALSKHIPDASVDDRVTGKLRPEVRGVEYRRPVSPSTLAIRSDFSGAERGSEPVSPIIPVSDSLLLPIFGNEAGGYRVV